MLIRDFEDKEFMRKAVWKDCYYDFAARYKRGDATNVEEYFKFLYKKGNDRLFFDVLAKKE